MQKLELVSFSIGVPGISDTTILEALAYGVSIMIDQHKKLGLPFDDITMQEHAKLTIGDHLCELIGHDEFGQDPFAQIYDAVVDQLEVILATYWLEMEEFTNQVDDIADIMPFWYPNLIRLCVAENPINANGNSQLYLS
jgi:hypothetical protein